MAPRKTKFVTLKLSSEELSKFPELTAHVQVKPKQRAKPKAPSTKLKLNLNSPEAASREQSLKPGGSFSDLIEGSNSPVANGSNMSNLNNNGGNSASSATATAIVGGPNVTGAKLSSNVRVGVSGLVMNTSIVRELDKSGRKTGKWAKFDTNEADLQNSNTETTVDGDSTTGISATEGSKKAAPNGNDKANSKSGLSEKKVPDVEDIDETHAVISMRDFRGFKDHDFKHKEDVIIEHARKSGRKVVRSFSGYLMLWPSWHKIEEGNLEKKVEGQSDNKQVGQKKKDSKSVSSSKGSPTKMNGGGLESTPSATNLKFGATAADSSVGAESRSASDAKTSTTPAQTPVKLEI